MEQDDGNSPPQEEEAEEQPLLEGQQAHQEDNDEGQGEGKEEYGGDSGEQQEEEDTDEQQQRQMQTQMQTSSSAGVDEDEEELLGDALVGFRVFPDGLVLQPQPFDAGTSIKTMKQTIGEQLQVPWLHVVVRFGGVLAPTKSNLYDCGVFPGSTILGDIVVDPTQDSEEYKLPAEIMVQVKDDDTGEVAKLMKVAVERPEDYDKKPYLGGFRNKKTGAILHHAYTQTASAIKSRWANKKQMLTRETQTVDLVTRSTQTKREASTQMTKPGVFVDSSGDTCIYAKEYFSANELDKIRAEAALRLQCFWRCYVARRKAQERHDEKMSFHRKTREKQIREQTREQERQSEHEMRRTNPRTKEDFAILYTEVQNWTKTEMEKIQEDHSLSEEDKAQARADVLEKETEMIQRINRLKSQAAKEAKSKHVKKTLKEMSAPKKWEMSDGEIASVHTPFTCRATELRDLYLSLEAGGEALPINERLDVLLNVKYTVKEFDCGLTREIVEIIDREADLLNRNRRQSTMGNMRKRLSNLFLQWISTPEFNSEASRFQKVAQPLAMRPDVKPILDPKERRRGMNETWSAVHRSRSKFSETMNGGFDGSLVNSHPSTYHELGPENQ
eukprot:gb/GECG01014001.1/.p1 GENE.gb/GECG01014001.1/~~gb/GECG01014001.1/.p1  ORF type:complete len:614 (+),score=110.50 gb/GECG01014001.1/:1-1842(+)